MTRVWMSLPLPKRSFDDEQRLRRRHQSVTLLRCDNDSHDLAMMVSFKVKVLIGINVIKDTAFINQAEPAYNYKLDEEDTRCRTQDDRTGTLVRSASMLSQSPRASLRTRRREASMSCR